jgi:SapC
MINPNLHKTPVALDRDKHRGLKLKRDVGNASVYGQLNAMFVAAAEFAEACREHPVVWVRAGQGDDGKPQIASVCVFGVTANQNLCVEGGQWRVRYVPALLRAYPFAMARVGENQLAVCFDQSWPGVNETEGEALFQADGQPTELLQTVQKQLEELEVEIERTRLVGAKLLEKNLLQDMRFDATLPDGQKLTVDGFLTVDEKKLAELSDADVLEFHRNGLMGLIHAHQISLGNMRRLTEWHAERVQAAAKPAA